LIVLSIGTTHPWNVAGIGRDLVVGAEFGARVFSAVAAVSAQDGRGVTALHPVPPNVLDAQLTALPWDAAAAVRVGALPTATAVQAVTKSLRAHPWLIAVVDPVFTASRGGTLSDSAARHALRDQLGSLASVVLTPNLEEAAFLLAREKIDRSSLAESALALHRRGLAAALIKGGHLEDDPADALAAAGGVEIFSEPRIAGAMHGIGCTLAMALACELGAGKPVAQAVRGARAYVRAQLARH